jgi:hemoglobin/transferrin/lactoferrin receptor protein
MRCSVSALALYLAVVVVAVRPAAGQEAGRSGRVIDESGAAIGGAHLVLRSVHESVLQEVETHADGGFSLGPLPSGTYSLEVTAARFASRHLSIAFGGPDASAALDVVLGLAPVHEAVTVTAGRGTVAGVDRAAPIVSVRDADGFRARPLPTLGSALDGATGVMMQQSTYGQASPFLRGLTGYQVLNLVDGVRLNNTTFRSGPNQYLAWIDPGQAQRVEAMLGPASAQFGSDAMGGAIHVLTPAASFRAIGGPAATGLATLFGGSADRSWGADAGAALRGRHVTAILGAARRELGDLRGGGGHDSHHVLTRLFGLSGQQVAGVMGERQVDTGFTQSSLHAKVAARVSDRQHLTTWYQQGAQEGVRGYKDLWGGLGRLRSDFDPQRLQFFYTRYEGLAVGPLDWLSATFSLNSQRDGSDRQNLRFSDPIVQDRVETDAFGYAVQGGVHVGSRHSLVFGGEAYDEHVDARRHETDPVSGLTVQKRALYPNGSRYLTTGLFVQDDAELVRGNEGRLLVARLGGRFTRVGLRTDAAKNVSDSGQSLGVVDSRQSYQDLTFSAGLTWTPVRRISLHGLVGRGFRAPNLNDLGALGLNDLGYEVPADATIEAGSFIGSSDGEGALSSSRRVSSLASERLLNYEAGVAFNGDRLYARLQAFDAELEDPIVRRTILFPIDSPPSSLAGLAVTPIAPTAAQKAQGVVPVATALDPRAVKAFVNEGRARYYGVDAVARWRFSKGWSTEANYSYLVGNDLDPSRPVRRLPPQQGMVAVRWQPGWRLSWMEASTSFAGSQTRLSGGDVTDERIGASRRRSDITDFFRGGLISPFILQGADGVAGTADDLFGPTGETVAQIRDRVLPIGALINGVLVVSDSTRVPLYTKTAGWIALNVRAGFAIAQRLNVNVALTNALDANYRVHGSGVDAPGRCVFASADVNF